MSSSPLSTRRQILRAAALGATGLTLWPAARGLAAAAAETTPAFSSSDREHGLRLGVATYSTRVLSVDDTITALKALRIANAGVFRTHCNWETASVDECRALAEKFQAAGIAISGSGVINFSTDEAKARQAFENAKAARMVVMVCKPSLDALPLVERLAKEYDQKLAIHNHGPEDAVYPSPAEVWSAIKSLDSRLGLCLDVGHAMRANTDPVAAIRQYAPRLYDVHLKDSLALPGSKTDLPTEIGVGRMDIRGMLRALLEIKYTGVVALEYEKVAGNPVTGLAESLGYVRGLLSAVAPA